MAENNTQNKLMTAAGSLAVVRGILLEVGREAVEAEDAAGWQVAKDTLALAEMIDSVRKKVASLMRPAEPQIDGYVSLGRAEPATASMTTRKRRADYPKFVVRDDSLVKIGLGRDRRSEYEHTVSKTEFDSIVLGISELLTEHRSFSAEVLQEKLTCPAYRTYIVLALLRKVGVLDSRQRGKYVARSLGSFESDAQRVWTETTAAH